jgi:hypothetical protein
MTANKYHITGHCTIRQQKISRNGTLLFTGGEAQPSSFFVEAYKHFNINYPKFYKMDSLCKLGVLASEILMEGKNIPGKYKGEDIGIILYNAASSVDTDRIHQQSISDRSAYFPSPSVFVYTLANIVIGEICIRHKIYGESAFFIEDAFHADGLYQYVSQLLDENIVECCLAGWIELDGDHYDGVLYLIEKSTSGKEGITIFEPEKLAEIYLQ